MFSLASSNLELPNTIRVLVTGKAEESLEECRNNDSYPVREISFKEYVRNVLANEWRSSWDKEALQAGAMAVKTFAWYHLTVVRKYPGRGYDVRDSTCDQVYKNGSSHPNTDKAIDETWNWVMTKSDRIFHAQYDSGTPGSPNPLYQGRISQEGTQYWAKQGKNWQEILQYYHSNAIKFTAIKTAPAPPVNLRVQ